MPSIPRTHRIRMEESADPCPDARIGPMVHRSVSRPFRRFKMGSTAGGDLLATGVRVAAAA
jgi:hypothetical protein